MDDEENCSPLRKQLPTVLITYSPQATENGPQNERLSASCGRDDVSMHSVADSRDASPKHLGVNEDVYA
jgi:hypothetical protein